MSERMPARMTELEAANELRMPVERLQRIRRAGWIAYEQDGRFCYYTPAFLADYRARITCPANDSSSGNTGSQNVRTLRSGAERGSTRQRDRLADLRLAQTILSGQKSHLRSGT